MIVLEYISFSVGIIGATVIIWGVIKGIFGLVGVEYAKFKASGHQKIEPSDQVRLGISFNLLWGWSSLSLPTLSAPL